MDLAKSAQLVRTTGATIKSPNTSPIHHTTQVAPNCPNSIARVARSEPTPIVAETNVLTSAPNTTNLTISGTVDKDASKLANLSKYDPTNASSVLPIAIPNAPATDAPVKRFIKKAAIKMAGQ